MRESPGTPIEGAWGTTRGAMIWVLHGFKFGSDMFFISEYVFQILSRIFDSAGVDLR